MNMKKIVIASIATLGLSVTAQASTLASTNSSVETNLCMTAASGNRAKLYNTIKASGKSTEFVAKNVTCNGKNILAFVEQHGKRSENIVNMLDRSSRQVTITDVAQNNIQE